MIPDFFYHPLERFNYEFIVKITFDIYLLKTSNNICILVSNAVKFEL